MNLTAMTVVLGFCVACSFLLSGMEAGVFAVNRLRIRKLARAGDRRAQMLNRFLEQPEDFLWTIFVGNSLASLVAVGLGVAWLHERVGQYPVWFWTVMAIGVFLFYAFCDLFPKMLFRTYPNRLCLVLARPFRLLRLALAPLVSFVRWLSHGLLQWSGGRTFTGRLFGNRDELRQVMQDSSHGLTTEERGMINRVLDLQNLTVGRITTSLEKAVTVTMETPMEEVLRLCRERNLTRLPVWQETEGRRRIAGVVSLRALLFGTDFDPGCRAGEYVKPALYLDEDLRLEAALRRMQQSGERLAIVLSRDRREVGILTLQDILRVIFGEVNL